MDIKKFIALFKHNTVIKVISCGIVMVAFYLLLESKTSPPAIYIPQPNETPVTSIWDNTWVSCNGKPFNMWDSPGTYLYKHNGSYFTMKPGAVSPSFGMSGPAQLSVAGTESITTALGTFQATHLNAQRDYDILTGRLDRIQGTFRRDEWYVCGLGLIKLTSSISETKTPGNYSHSDSDDFVLLSFTPLTTNESHVRYILADIQLGKNASAYRANITDEETAEALRRWKAGVRVMNINKFKRKIVNGQWLIVYAETKNQINGLDAILTSD